MLNKLEAFLREYHMISRGDSVICAVSGGADSMALLWGMYLLKEKLDIELSAAHFNHHLRGEDSNRDDSSWFLYLFTNSVAKDTLFS